jgi:Arc/MetJ-type ribon-helix-helix transcriptional regulator
MSQTYSKHVSAYVTPEMYQFLQLLAERHKVSVSDVVRQAIREHLDEQEDVIGSRSRLGRTMMDRMEAMHRQLLRQLLHLGKLLLAAVIVLLSEQGIDADQVVKRVTTVARQPALDKILEAGK